MSRADEIREDIKEARQHIENTGSAMVEKLEMLEHRLRESVESVKRHFDLHYQASRHPWALLGGSVLAGYLLGARRSSRYSRTNWVSRSRRRQSKWSGAGNHVKDELATAVKGVAAGVAVGAVKRTLWGLAKQTLLRRGRHENGRRYDGRERIAAAEKRL